MICSPDVLGRVASKEPAPREPDTAATTHRRPARGLLSGLFHTAPLVHPEPTFRDTLARIKYFFRGLSTPRLTARWFALLQAPELRPLVNQPHPLIYCKLQRPYLHRRLGTSARLDVLQHHYRFIQEYLPQDLRTKILQPGGCVLAVLPVEPAGRFTLRLSYAYRFVKEGDLNLEIIDETNSGALFTLTFSVTRYEKGSPSQLFIGGLQGHPLPGQKELIIDITRSMHGLRPKALLVFALQRLAQLWNFSALHGVGDAEHTHRRNVNRKDRHACYDDFWLECLGQPMPDGNFSLPVFPVARDMNELPTKKRPLYRRRYQMLASLGEEIRRSLTPVQPQPIVQAAVVAR
jgi:uncharacterized protein VirK/YbjX